MKIYIIIILIILLIICFAFYWYEYRPSQIKKECYGTAVEMAQKKAGREDEKFRADDYNTYYKLCLEKRGL